MSEKMMWAVLVATALVLALVSLVEWALLGSLVTAFACHGVVTVMLALATLKLGRGEIPPGFAALIGLAAALGLAAIHRFALPILPSLYDMWDEIASPLSGLTQGRAPGPEAVMPYSLGLAIPFLLSWWFCWRPWRERRGE